MTSENAVEVTNLTKHFNGLVAVNNISFEVKNSELFGFLGPNGAGKTTTIRMLTGVIKPDKGSASIFGYDVVKQGLKARQLMGIVPEMSNAYVDLSAWNNLMLVGGLYGVNKNQRTERATSLLKKFDLYERRNQLVKGFSKGMKQKLLLCMALISDPQILFLDEPTSGLDVESQRLIKDMVREFNANGTTVFLTTHNMEEANQLCDRVAIINRGKIAEIDSPEKVRQQSCGLQTIEISFDNPVNAEDLLKLPSVNGANKMGDKLRLCVDDTGAAIDALVDYARSKKLNIISLNTLAPSLEDVFLQLVKES
ncbi:MAG TPA: ATP-binding cassette domain-containing protein [Candidatus Bathyarchaeota archaeon]|nr:ATP-binding cassette domain-containing protein [Candidatus Bathyarchaeota archaeon]